MTGIALFFWTGEGLTDTVLLVEAHVTRWTVAVLDLDDDVEEEVGTG